MTDTYQYDRPFRLKILSLMLDNLWMVQYGDGTIKPEFFEQDDEEKVCSAITDYRERYHISPKDPEDIIALLEGEKDNVHDLVYEIYDEDEDLHLACDLAVTFAKEQALKIAILDSVDDITKGDLSKIESRIRDAISIGENQIVEGLDPFKDSDKWLYDYWSDKIPTRWIHVDEVLEGGMGPGELGIILAPQNAGKSMALINVGVGAISIGSGKNVLHISHEMSPEQVAKRYAARIMFRFPRKSDNLEDYDEELQRTARRLIPGKVKIVGGHRMNQQEVERLIERTIASGFVPDEIIDDYPDLIKPMRKYTDKRHELSEIYEWYRYLGWKYSCPMWGASQSRRNSHSKEIITLSDIAEDIGKASIADVIVSLCQTPEEEANNLCRLFMAKVRDGRRHDVIRAKYFGASQAIVTTEFVRQRIEAGGEDV